MSGTLPPSPAGQISLADRFRRYKHPLFVLLLTFAIFAPSLRFGFVYDDVSQVVENPTIRSWSYVPYYFTRHVWAHNRLNRPLYYRPLFLVAYRIEYAIFGLHPWGWHLTLVLAHLFACWAVYKFVHALSDAPTALPGMYIFALHPVHVEVVSWVACLIEPLMVAALLGCYMLYVGQSKHRRGWSVGLFWVALLLKETAIVWPAFLFLATYTDLKETLKKTLPFWLSATAYMALHSAFGGHPNNLVFAMGTAPAAFWFFVRQLFYPVNLSPAYRLPVGFLPFIGAIAAAAALVYIGALGKFFRLAAIIIILPLLLILPFNSDPITLAWLHDRYLYLPSVGFAMLAAVPLRRVPKPVAGVLVALMAVGCVREARPWHDDIKLFTRAVEVAPQNYSMRNRLAVAYIDADQCDKAMPLLYQVVEQRSDAWNAYVNMADCFEANNQLEDAEKSLGTAEMLYPDPEIEANLARLRKLRHPQP